MLNIRNIDKKLNSLKYCFVNLYMWTQRRKFIFTGIICHFVYVLSSSNIDTLNVYYEFVNYDWYSNV